jgi:hypothetical protein
LRRKQSLSALIDAKHTRSPPLLAARYTGLWCRKTEWTTQWSCCLREPGRGGPDHSWSPDDEPLLLLQCNSEVEAALTHDLGALWLTLNATGG